MGEPACYLYMLDAEGRLVESPVRLWPLESNLPAPPGLRVMLGAEEPPPDLFPLRLPELASVDQASLQSPEYAARLQMLVNAAREGPVVILYGSEERDSAEALAEAIRSCLG